jgi:hypothetical protein
MDWLEETVDRIIDCPANSSDVSPIELVWGFSRNLSDEWKGRRFKNWRVGCWVHGIWFRKTQTINCVRDFRRYSSFASWITGNEFPISSGKWPNETSW